MNDASADSPIDAAMAAPDATRGEILPEDDVRYATPEKQFVRPREQEDAMRKRGNRAAGRYRAEAEWEIGRSVFTHGISAAGSIIYKGQNIATGEHRFLLRHYWRDGEARRQASTMITAPTASDAEKMLAGWIQKVRNGRVLPRTFASLTDFVEQEWMAARVSRLAGSTYLTERALWNVRIKPFLGHLRPDQLTKAAVAQWVATNASGATLERPSKRAAGRIVTLSTNPRTVRNGLRLFTTILHAMVDAELIATNPMPSGRKKKSRKERVGTVAHSKKAGLRYWTRDEVAEFWERAGAYANGHGTLEYLARRTSAERARGRAGLRKDRMDPYGATICFLYGGFGLAFATRPGEACAARWEDLRQTEEGWVLDVGASIGRPDADRLLVAGCPAWDRTLTKTGAAADVLDISGFVDSFLIPFRQYQAKVLAGGHDPAGYIFARRDGSFYSPACIAEKWSHFTAGIGMSRSITPYGLRHTHATLLLEHGASMKAISERLRHADVTVTAQVYAHVTARLAQKAAATVVDCGLVPVAASPIQRARASAARPSPRVIGMTDWTKQRRSA